MIGLTPHERELAVARDRRAGFGFALAELSLYWDNHHDGAPEMHQPVINIRAAALTEVQAVAAWLGVEVHERYGTHLAQRRFGTGDDSIMVEAHFTPDHDRAHALRTEAADKARSERDDAGSLVAA